MINCGEIFDNIGMKNIYKIIFDCNEFPGIQT